MKSTASRKFTTEWAFKEGVFKTPQGKFIARIKVNNNRYETISIHPTYEEAEKAYQAKKNGA